MSGARGGITRVVPAARWAAASVLVSTLALASSARAEDAAPEPARHDAGLQAAAAGAFLPQTLSAQVGAVPLFAFGLGGYDSARQGSLADAAVEVRIWGPFALRAQTTYSNVAGRMRPSVGGRAQLLRQPAHGIDGTLTVFYKTEGFTEAEGEIETFASIGRRFEQLSVLGNLVYGQDPEGNERDGEVRAAVLHQRGRLIVGLDSRLRFAIGTQHGRAATTEPAFDLAGGPVATVAAGPVALYTELGPSTFRLEGGPVRVGVAALAGLGAAY